MAFCYKCTEILFSGKTDPKLKVTVALSVEELEHFAHCTLDEDLRERLLTALGLIDAGAEDRVRRDISEAGFGKTKSRSKRPSKRP